MNLQSLNILDICQNLCAYVWAGLKETEMYFINSQWLLLKRIQV